MKKTNKKMIAILVSIIVVVAAFVLFEIPAFAEEMNINEENIEMTVENENELESEEQEINNENKIKAEFEFDFTFENDYESIIEPVEENSDNEIYIAIIDIQDENEVAEDESNDENEEVTKELENEETTKNEEKEEVVEKLEEQVIETVEIEEMTVEQTFEKTTENEEKAIAKAPEQEKTEINKCENKFYTEFANGVIVNTSTESNDIINDFAPVTDFTLNCVQDIDTFRVNEKRAIIA